MTRIREEHRSCVICLWHVGQEVKSGIIIYEECLRISTLAANIVWTLHGVPDEEYRPVQSDYVVVAFTSIHLDCESSRVSSQVWKLLTKGDGRESQKQWGFFANVGQEIRFTQTLDIFGRLKEAKMPRAGGMYAPFHDLVSHESLLLFEQEWVTRHRQAADVQSVLPVGGPWGSKVAGYKLRVIRNLALCGSRDARGLSDDISRASVRILETRQVLAILHSAPR